MHPSSDYRAQAQKYVEQAAHARSSNHRFILLQKAETLMRMARNAELTQRVLDEVAG
jgi:hypothetical protein